MNKPLYIIISVFIFLIIDPLFNCLFAYTLICFDDYGSLYLSLDNFMFLIFLSYLTTFIPAAITGLVYGLLSPTRKKTILLWLIPLLGCIIYLVYAFIFEMVTHLFGSGIIYVALVIALLSIGATFISTLLSNIILKGKHL